MKKPEQILSDALENAYKEGLKEGFETCLKLICQKIQEELDSGTKK